MGSNRDCLRRFSVEFLRERVITFYLVFEETKEFVVLVSVSELLDTPPLQVLLIPFVGCRRVSDLRDDPDAIKPLKVLPGRIHPVFRTVGDLTRGCGTTQSEHSIKEIVPSAILGNEILRSDETIEIRLVPMFIGVCFQFGTWIFHTGYVVFRLLICSMSS